MKSAPVIPVKNPSRFLPPTQNVGLHMDAFAAKSAKAKPCSEVMKGLAIGVEKTSTLEQARSSRDMQISALSNAGRQAMRLDNILVASFVEREFGVLNGKSIMVGQGSARKHADPSQPEACHTNGILSHSSRGNGKNGFQIGASNVEQQSRQERESLWNSTMLFQDSLAVRQKSGMFKPFADRAIKENIGQKICRTTHGSKNTLRIMEVIKFSLIDLDASTEVTGRKQAKAVQRERLSERTPETAMRQSEPAYNVIKKCGREIRSGFSASKEVIKVTDCMYYSGSEVLNVSASDVISSAEFDWKQAACAVVINGLEQDVQNVGKAQVIDLLEGRITNAQRTMKNQVTVGMYSDGTGTGGKQIGGLQLLVADDPTTGTVGGISRSAFSFWQNKLLDASVQGAATSATNIQTYWNTLWLRCSRGTDRPDLILADSAYFAFFWASLQAIQRIYDPKMGQLGFQTVKFNTADVVYEDSTGMPASHAYFLNTDYIFLRYAPRRLFKPLDKVMSINQDAMVQLITFAGNMTVSNSSLQGVHHE